MGWRDQEAYDDWDSIVEAIYGALVESSIRHVTSVKEQSITLPPYNMSMASYGDNPHIRLLVASTPKALAFHSFGTYENPFDVVRAAVVDSPANHPEYPLSVFPISDVEFLLWTSAGLLRELNVVT
jgi:hypothetical protein